jgi:hypothetical protein
MTIAKITRSGLAGMTVSVALLWGCLISEHYVVRRAGIERARALYNMERLRRGRLPQPVSAPGPRLPRPFTTALG